MQVPTTLEPLPVLMDRTEVLLGAHVALSGAWVTFPAAVKVCEQVAPAGQTPPDSAVKVTEEGVTTTVVSVWVALTVSVAVPVDAPPFVDAVITEVQVLTTGNAFRIEPFTIAQLVVPEEREAVPVAEAFARKVANRVPVFCPVGENPAMFVLVPPEAIALVIWPSSKTGTESAKVE